MSTGKRWIFASQISSWDVFREADHDAENLALTNSLFPQGIGEVAFLPNLTPEKVPCLPLVLSGVSWKDLGAAFSTATGSILAVTWKATLDFTGGSRTHFVFACPEKTAPCSSNRVLRSVTFSLTLLSGWKVGLSMAGWFVG